MKTSLKSLCFMFVLIAGLGLMPVDRLAAQTFTTLYTFTGGSLGANPNGLVLSGNTLYGTASSSSSQNRGMVFALNTNGKSFTNLYSFTHISSGNTTNSDGAGPNGLILSGNTLYGTAGGGGSNGVGTVFSVNTNGTGFRNIYSFTGLSSSVNGTNSDGAFPNPGVALLGNTLYGTTLFGGSLVDGTVFAVNTNGTCFTNLHNFTGYDGFGSSAGLTISGNTLYGTTTGRIGGSGTVFAIHTDGTSFTNLYNFSFTGENDGGFPYTGLALSGGMLYGTTYIGGSGNAGTVFAVNTDGTGFTNLHSFSATYTNSMGVYTNSDGSAPFAVLNISGNTLYGTAGTGGSSGGGTVFAVNTNGTGFTILHTFTATSGTFPSSTNSDGANPPSGGLILSGNTLYGAAITGGTNGYGTVFSITLPAVSVPRPQLIIVRSGPNVVLTWPTNAAGFTLQSTTNVSPTLWGIVSPAPVVVDTNNTVTNTISGTRKFYRLIQ